MRIFCITDNTDTYTGMRLAGIGGAVVHTAEELEKTVTDVLNDGVTALVLITPKAREINSALIDSAFDGAGKPLLLEIPDRHGEATGAGLRDYMRSVLGRDIM